LPSSGFVFEEIFESLSFGSSENLRYQPGDSLGGLFSLYRMELLSHVSKTSFEEFRTLA